MNQPARPRRQSAGPSRTSEAFFLLSNEFAAVRVSVDRRGNGPRLLVENVESGARIMLSPLELASLCLADADDRRSWLRVGEYRDDRAVSGRPGTPGGAEPA